MGFVLGENSATLLTDLFLAPRATMYPNVVSLMINQLNRLLSGCGKGLWPSRSGCASFVRCVFAAVLWWLVEVAEMGFKMARWKNTWIINEVLPMILLFEKATDQ